MSRQQGHVDAWGVLVWSPGGLLVPPPPLPEHILDVFQTEYDANFISKSPRDSKPGLFF